MVGEGAREGGQGGRCEGERELAGLGNELTGCEERPRCCVEEVGAYIARGRKRGAPGWISTGVDVPEVGGDELRSESGSGSAVAGGWLMLSLVVDE